MSWIVIFLFLVGLGTAGFLSTVPGRRVPPLFFRLGSLLMVASAVIGSLAGWSFFQSRPVNATEAYARVLGVGFVVSCLLMAIMVRMMGAVVRSELFIMPAALGAAFVIMFALWKHHDRLDAGLLAASLLASAAALGGSLVATIIAGWRAAYESFPGDEVLRITRLLVWALILRLLIAVMLPLLLPPRDTVATMRIVAVAGGLILAIAAHRHARKGSAKVTAVFTLCAMLAILAGELSSIYMTMFPSPAA